MRKILDCPSSAKIIFSHFVKILYKCLVPALDDNKIAKHSHICENPDVSIIYRQTVRNPFARRACIVSRTFSLRLSTAPTHSSSTPNLSSSPLARLRVRTEVVVKTLTRPISRSWFGFCRLSIDFHWAIRLIILNLTEFTNDMLKLLPFVRFDNHADVPQFKMSFMLQSPLHDITPCA